MKLILKALTIAVALSSVITIQAAESLDQLNLPPVPKAPWTFTKFPILAWWGPPGSASPQDFANYRDAGINIYLANPDTGFDDAIKKATDAGLAIMPFRDKQGFGLEKAKVRFPKDNPNVVGWIASDEPSGVEAVSYSITVMNRLMRKDPTRRTLFNLLPIQKDPSTTEVIKAAVRNGLPIISYDHYVILHDGGTNDIIHYKRLKAIRRESLRYDVPFWAFALTIQHFHYRRPSESDVRWKQFTNLAYGAKGLWYFTYWGPTDWENWDNKAIVNPADGSKTELYGYVKAINNNVQSMGQTLLKLTSKKVMHTKPTDGQATFEKNKRWIADIVAKDAIVSFFKHEDGAKYAMIVNKLHGMEKSAAQTSDSITLTFAPNVKAVEAVAWLDGKPGPLAIKNHQATLAIGGGTGVLLKLTDKGKARRE